MVEQNKFITRVWRGSEKASVASMEGIVELGKAIKKKRIRETPSVSN